MEKHHEWLTAGEAAAHARCGVKVIYRAVQTNRLRAARVNGRRDLRFLVHWIDAWLLASATPEIVNPDAPGDDVPCDRLKSPAH
jgi:excisionase family DNA binding protein